MKLVRMAILALAVALLAPPPELAHARAGGSYSAGRSSPSYGSMGSRGSRTYSPDSGAPISRSMTPYQQGQPSYGSGYNGRPGFWSGVLGGLGGAWLASHLFGGGYGGYGYGGGGGFFSFLITLLVLFFVFRWLFRSFSSGALRNPMSGFAPANPGLSYAAPQAAGLSLGDNDLAAFQNTLITVQRAWGDGDLNRMRGAVTPEMLSYFADQLARNQSLGLTNRVENIMLERGEPRETWSENGSDYATCLLEWSACDYTARNDRAPGAPGYLVEGEPNRPILSQELWTFQRVRGGRWLLSAIQQTR